MSLGSIRDCAVVVPKCGKENTTRVSASTEITIRSEIEFLVLYAVPYLPMKKSSLMYR